MKRPRQKELCVQKSLKRQKERGRDMGDGNIKLIRKQIRNVCHEMLNDEIFKTIEEKVLVEIGKRMQGIEEHVKKIMQEMNDRNKDTNGYLVRQATLMQQQGNAAQAQPEAETQEENKS
jgi:hypothetical protein